MGRQETRQEKVFRFLFGTATFHSERHLVMTVVLSVTFVALALAALVHFSGYGDYMAAVLFGVICLPLAVTACWAEWKDSQDEVD